MKRKRKGGKKSKSKKPKIVKENEVMDNVAPSNPEENHVVDLSDNDEADSGAEADSPSSVAADLPESSPVAADLPESSPVAADLPESSPVAADLPESSPVAADLPEGSPVEADLPESSSVLTVKNEPVNPTRPTEDTADKSAHARVKVKIKSSKALDTQHTSSDAPTQSDTDKSCQQVEVENQVAASEKMEDSANSVPESNSGIPGAASKNLGSIKIKSIGFGSSTMSPCSNVEAIKGETKQKDPELLIRKRQTDKQQLDASLEVIKKVMKMDAAEPFNVPVDPIALNIPDYFDVIKTPMDFGTICKNLESGTKYLNSEDVYKDVQYIWDNCFNYNNKGAYILELMKRVKKNFLKYWIAAGLYCDQTSGNNSGETVQVKDVTPSSDGVMSTKNGPSTPATTKKHHGLKKHKDGCMCAICVMMRRRQEREETARLLNPDFEMSEDYMDEDGKHQGDSSMGSPAEYTSKNMENASESRYESMDDGREDDKFSELGQLYRRSRDDSSAQTHAWEGTTPQHANEPKNKETLDKNRKAAMYERLRYMENPRLFNLCGSLFNDEKASVWNGPHSLIKNEASTRKITLLSTISSFMK